MGRSRHGRPIGAQVMPDPPAPVCDQWCGIDPTDPAFGHITRALGDLAALYGFDPRDKKIIAGAIRYGRRAFEADRKSWQDAMVGSPPIEGSVVYYMRIGNRCKIGFSTNISTRLEAINPEELLATEPGGQAQETARHVQFRKLRTHGEWFRYEDPLVEHVAKLQAAAPQLEETGFIRSLRTPLTPLEHAAATLYGG